MTDLKDLAVKLGGTIPQRPPFRPPPNPWRTVTLTFDDVASGTAVDTTYASAGVTFASVTYPPRTWSAYAREMPSGAANAPSGKNVLSLIETTPAFPWFDARYGAVEASFSQLQQSITIWAYAVDAPEGSGSADNRPFMEAYDSAGTYLGKVKTQLGIHDANFLNHWHPLSFSSASRNIARIRLSSQANGLPWVYTAFDNLSFDRNIFVRPF